MSGQRYTPEFKDEAVRQVIERGDSVGEVALPTALAIGELQRVSGRDLILAFVLGYEVLGKLGSAAQL